MRERPKRLHFGGGEPTLYIDSINDLCDAHPDLNTTRVEVVTNGWFATSEEKIAKTVAKFRRITKFHMSFDAFHHSETSEDRVRQLSEFTRKNQIQFQLTMAISSPLELLSAKELTKHLKEPINFQPVGKTGRAIDTGVEFKYKVFNHGVLNKKCPSQGQISFMPRKGFSVCCSTLVFDGHWEAASDFDLTRYRQSEFHEDMTTLKFSDLLMKYNVTLENPDPNLSDACNLCQHIFAQRSRAAE